MAPLSDSVKDFAESSTGRIVTVAVPAVILAIIIAFVALTMVRSNATSEVADTAGSTEAASSAKEKEAVDPGKATGAAADTTTSAAVAETTDTTGSYINENFEVYETRDPFKAYDASATLSAAPATTPAGTSGSQPAGTSGGTSTTEVLTLKGIQVSQDDISYAEVSYGSAGYTVKAGERVGSSPYQVVSVGSDSATFLFGDDQVVLGIGDSADK